MIIRDILEQLQEKILSEHFFTQSTNDAVTLREAIVQHTTTTIEDIEKQYSERLNDTLETVTLGGLGWQGRLIATAHPTTSEILKNDGDEKKAFSITNEAKKRAFSFANEEKTAEVTVTPAKKKSGRPKKIV